MTVYPSVEKPWLKYYCKEARNATLPESTIYKYLWEKNKKHLDDVALIYFGRKITYDELFRNINRAARAFTSIGVKAGDIVALALPNIPENIYCVYALNKIGAVADMIDLRSKGDILTHYYNETSVTTAVICDMFSENTYSIKTNTKIRTAVVVSPFDSLPRYLKPFTKIKTGFSRLPDYAIKWNRFINNGNDASDKLCGDSDSVSCIFHTSGTTGTPKGVMMTNRNFNAMALQVELSGLRFDYGKRIMNQVPPFLAFNAICSMHVPLVRHMQMVLLPDYRPDLFAENIIKTKATCCLAGPADWNSFVENKRLKNKNIDLSMLVNPISGSDAMSSKAKKDINDFLKTKGCPQKVLEGYGMTEIGAAACCNMPQMNVDSSVGIPLPFNTFCIYDNENNKELNYGASGEICMTGPTVMKGYYNSPDETANALKKHDDGLIWLHSGDLGHIDENGCVFIEGRIKRVIVRHDGIKIYPFNVEKTILKHINVEACCVVGAADETNKMGQIPVAFVVLKDKTIDTLKEIEDLCKAELSEKYLPKSYFFIDSLPLTDNGKVDYRSMEKRAEKQF